MAKQQLSSQAVNAFLSSPACDACGLRLLLASATA